MTDIRDLARADEDDVAFAHRLIRDPGVAGVPGSSFFSRPELGRTKLRFAFPKTPRDARGGSGAPGAAGLRRDALGRTSGQSPPTAAGTTARTMSAIAARVSGPS